MTRTATIASARRQVAAVLAWAAAVALLVVGPAAPAQAAQDLPFCLRNAHLYTGGMLVYADQRLSSTQVDAFRDEMWDRGRVACVVRMVDGDVADATRHWASLPAHHRPQTVVLALRGDAAQIAAWREGPQPRRVTGATGSGLGWTFGWPAGLAGREAARRLLRHVGELTVYGGTFSGTYDAWLVRSSVTQCAKAAASPKGVLVLGDSITYRDFDGIRTRLAAEGYVPCVFAQRSGRVQDLLSLAKRQGVPMPQRIVIALGNNDLFVPPRFRYWMNQVYRWAGPDRDLVWLTVWRTKPSSLLPNLQYNARVVNRIIRDAQAERGTRSRSIDWYAVVYPHPSWMYDGIHLTPTGLDRRYDLMTATLAATMVS